MSLLAEGMRVLVFLVVLFATTYSACNCARQQALPLKKRYCDSTHTIVRARILIKSNALKRPIAPGGAALQYYAVSISRVMKGLDIKKVPHIYVHADCGVDLKVNATYMLEVEKVFFGFLLTPCGIADFWKNTRWLRDHLRRYKNDPRVYCQ